MSLKAGTAGRSPAGAAARALAVAAFAAALTTLPAHAANPFGVGLAEPSVTSGFLGAWLTDVARLQSEFYLALKSALKNASSDRMEGFVLIGLSFLYGILHAIGPGHGKAVISGYVLANRETIRNGALISLLSGFAQGVTAIGIVCVAILLLGATSIWMTRAEQLFEAGSFAVIMLMGLWLTWRKVLGPALAAMVVKRTDTPVFAMVARSEMAMAGGGSSGGHRTGGTFYCGSEAGGACTCGAHLPAPEMVAGRLELKSAAAAILAVGLRPCTGALIVLVFAMSQKAFLLGALATLAMSLGTGITVAAMVLIATGARGGLLRLGGHRPRLAAWLHKGLEGAAAICVLVFGTMMFAASLTTV
ncbi:nickel/cobalt efflux protein RcnA [Hartmannibacter diazotrophicus]|uniref:Nickel/cobalt efflux system n=1 Tax=Hartmannibacter diazotrophicus TaxID=1482074 RepID=A0A2C9DBF1_9HYPH|nr:nickel/cobalt transporter [Hartmannibacter diazotrophicus]SON57662.1 nickel/cobalt efflux protein RcnA [Hartmannibacter diazotrophicus]